MSDTYVLPDGRLTVNGLALLYKADAASIRKEFGYGPFTMGATPLDGRAVPAEWEATASAQIGEANKATGKTDWSSILDFGPVKLSQLSDATNIV
jgi:hypothetical protein